MTTTHTTAPALASDVQRMRTMLFAGYLVVTIKSPNGTEVKFRFTPRLDQEKRWDGRAWWLNRGNDYVAIVRRAGLGLELRRTDKSTNDPIILKATRLLLAGLAGNLHHDYQLTASDRCGSCCKPLTDPDEIGAGMHQACPGS